MKPPISTFILILITSHQFRGGQHASFDRLLCSISNLPIVEKDIQEHTLHFLDSRTINSSILFFYMCIIIFTKLQHLPQQGEENFQSAFRHFIDGSQDSESLNKCLT